MKNFKNEEVKMKYKELVEITTEALKIVADKMGDINMLFDLDLINYKSYYDIKSNIPIDEAVDKVSDGLLEKLNINDITTGALFYDSKVEQITYITDIIKYVFLRECFNEAFRKLKCNN